MARTTKKDIYAESGIQLIDSGKHIVSPLGIISPLLINGNDKIGKGIWHFSTLPTNQIFSVIINGKSYDVKGTCPCTCNGCYATKGHYNGNDVILSLAVKTILIREYLDFVERAIIAQIKADKIKAIRIHASGDFDGNPLYIEMWKRIARIFPNIVMWTYTKYSDFENAFDGIENAHIVPSIVKGKGFNFGHCDYIISLYEFLKEMGEDVYICRCGIDKNQHCVNCNSCMTRKYVLFLEHSTEYKPEKDPLYPVFCALVNSQPFPTPII